MRLYSDASNHRVHYMGENMKRSMAHLLFYQIGVIQNFFMYSGILPSPYIPTGVTTADGDPRVDLTELLYWIPFLSQPTHLTKLEIVIEHHCPEAEDLLRQL